MLENISDDYELCLSPYFRIKLDDEDQITREESDDYTFVVDCPIVAIATNDESKEIRLVVRGYNLAKEQDNIKVEL